MQTTRQLITGALRLINVVQVGEAVSPEIMNISISAFDQMIDSWSNERLMVYTINPYIFNTVGGQLDYYLGPGHEVETVGTIVPGSGYVDGSYTKVPLTGSATGVNALATITVSGGAVTIVQISTIYQGGGYGYIVGDVLTASNRDLGGSGSGFTVPVATVSAGDWDIQRPLRIEDASVIWNDPLQSNAVDIPMQLVNSSQYASISVKNTPSTFPFVIYDNGNFPLKTLSVWPVPTVATGIRLWLRQPLVDFTDLDAVISYPPGYERAFRFCLAVELAPEFGKTLKPELIATALKAKENLASMNAVPQYMSGDGALSGNSNSFNWITGDMLPMGMR